MFCLISFLFGHIFNGLFNIKFRLFTNENFSISCFLLSFITEPKHTNPGILERHNFIIYILVIWNSSHICCWLFFMLFIRFHHIPVAYAHSGPFFLVHLVPLPSHSILHTFSWVIFCLLTYYYRNDLFSKVLILGLVLSIELAYFPDIIYNWYFMVVDYNIL